MARATSFLQLAELCAALEATTKKLKKIELVRDFLHHLQPEEIAPAVRLITGHPLGGKISSPGDSRALEVSWHTIQRVLNEQGDELSSSGSFSILDVQNYFNNIAASSGRGSRQQKEKLLRELLTSMSDVEKRYLIKIIFGEMQHGVSEGMMMQAIAKAVGVGLEQVRRAAMFMGELGEVAKIGLQQGKEALAKIEFQLFRPVLPMLAELATDFEQVFKEHGGESAFEFKFDGARVQIHKHGHEVRIFSRRLAEVTESLPDVVELVQKEVRADEVVVEGEVIAVGDEQRPLPFQEVLRRFRRVHDVSAAMQEVPVKLYLFDLIYYQGQSMIDVPYRQRWEQLARICPPHLLAERLVTKSPEEAEQFLQKAMGQGHEGLMAKALDSLYSPGSRGKKWFKIKPAETLDLVIVAADWGYGRRTGWLSNYHLAARNEKSGEFQVIGKTFKGLTDAEFTEMTQRLQQLKVKEEGSTVYVHPQVVVEVAYNEIQRSPQYKSGFALRFARIRAIRDDKSPEQADTLLRVKRLYEQQFQRKARRIQEVNLLLEG